MRNSLNFSKTLPHLTVLTPMTTLFCTFWFYLIPKSVFEVFIADLVNTPVTRVTVNVAFFENGSSATCKFY